MKLNRKKCEIGVSQVKFFGELLTDEEVKPDPEKILVIRDIEPPTDNKSVTRSLLMINYISNFIPSVS